MVILILHVVVHIDQTLNFIIRTDMSGNHTNQGKQNKPICWHAIPGEPLMACKEMIKIVSNIP